MAKLSHRDLIHLYQEVAESNNGQVRTEQFVNLLKLWQVEKKYLDALIKDLDPGKSGSISGQEISSLLKIPFENRKEDEIPNGISVVTTDIKKYRLLNILKIIKINMNEHGNPEMMLRQIKIDLDRIYGRTHHCFLVRGKYHGYYSHETGTSAVIKIEEAIFVIYKSPDGNVTSIA